MKKDRLEKKEKKISLFPTGAPRYSTTLLLGRIFLFLPLTHHFSIYLVQFKVGSAFLVIYEIMFRPNHGRKHLCHSERAGIIALSSTGKSPREIADAQEISKSAVAY
jgi:hypothetical protein